MKDSMMIVNYENSKINTAEIDGEFAVCAKDIAKVLGFVNPADAVSKHCKGVAIRYPLKTAGGTHDARFIKEPDLYRLILRANTEAAEKFQDFVCEEMLPQFRKRGFYISKAATAATRELLKLEFQANAVRAGIEKEAWELKARQALEIEGAVPVVDWIKGNLRELDDKQAANLSRNLKRVLAEELGLPVGSMSVPRRGKRLSARPDDLARALAALTNVNPNQLEFS